MGDTKLLNDPLVTANIYLEKYNQIINSTNQIALLLLIVIFFSWAYIIEPLNVKYLSSKKEYIKNIGLIEDSLRYISGEEQYATMRLYNIIETENEKDASQKTEKYISQKISNYFSDSIKALTNKQRTTADSLFKVHNKLKQREDSLKASLKSVINIQSAQTSDFVKDIPFPFKTIFYFTNNLKNGPQTIIFLIMLFVIFCYFRRYLALKFSARSVRIYKQTDSWKMNNLNDIIITAPFWLAPIPPKKNKELSNEELTILFGYSDKKTWNYLLVAIVLSILFAIQIRQLILAFSYERFQITLQYLINCGLVFITLTVIFIWLFPIYIPDKQINEPIITSDSRRQFIIAAIMSIIGLAMVTNSRKIIRLFLKDKYTKNGKSLIFSDIAKGWYINKKTKKIHYFDDRGYSMVMKSIDSDKNFSGFKKTLKKIDDKEITLKDISSIAHFKKAFVLEHFILNELKNKNDIYNSYTILVDYVNKNPINYRLWDLAAKIKVLYQNKEIDACFKELCLNHPGTFNKTLPARIEKYNSVKWQQKISSNKARTVFFNSCKIM